MTLSSESALSPAVSQIADDMPASDDASLDVYTPRVSATKVYVRVRPFHPRELSDGAGRQTCTVRVGPREGIITVLDPSKNYAPRVVYSFDRCFDSTAGGDQREVYQHVGQGVLRNVVNGYNGCVLAYGQTGSGKTYTMFGPQAGPEETPPPPDVETDGLVPRLARDLFESLRLKHQRASTHTFRVEVEYYEIYNEKIFDILAGGRGNNGVTELRLRHQPTCGAHVEGLSRKHVVDEKEMVHWIRRGNSQRHTASTRMNDCSSRSHAILSVHVAQVSLNDNGNASRVNSKLNLVDLAGSERTGTSCVEGKHFKESTRINLSLTVLGRVIDALADICSGKHGVFCPYRDSNLTWLLMDSLGGNSKTSMVATISPSSLHLEETNQTLRYASRAKQIVNNATINEDPQVSQIQALEAEVKRLQFLLRRQTQSVHRNEGMEQLQDQILKLELDIASRDHTIDGLRSKLVEKHVAEFRQAGDEDPQLKKQAKESKRAKSTVAQLQDKLKAAAEETAMLRAQVTELEARQEPKTSRRSVVPCKPEADGGKGSVTASLPFDLSDKTLQRLKSLGIDAREMTITGLIDFLALCAVDARRKSEEMFRKNATMIEFYSRALRECTQQLEDKERFVLIAAGMNSVSSFEKMQARAERALGTQRKKEAEETKRMNTSNSRKDDPAQSPEKQLQKRDKELENMSFQLKAARERVRSETALLKRAQSEKEELQQRLETLSAEVESLREQCGKNEKKALLHHLQEEQMRKNLEKTELMLAEKTKKTAVLLQNNAEAFRSVYVLMAKLFEERHHTFASEANARFDLFLRHREWLLQRERRVMEGNIREHQAECSVTVSQAEAHVSTLQNERDLLRQSLAISEKKRIDSAVSLKLACDSHFDALFGLFCEKTRLLEDVYGLSRARCLERQTAILEEMACVKRDMEAQAQNAHSLLKQETVRCNEVVQKKEEELVQAKALYEHGMKTQRTVHRMEVCIQSHYVDEYLKATAHQLSSVLELNKDKTRMMIMDVQKKYNNHTQKLLVEVEGTKAAIASIQEELRLSKENHGRQQRVIQEQKDTITMLRQEKEQMETSFIEEQKKLHDRFLECEAAKEKATQDFSDRTKHVAAVVHLIEVQAALYSEYMKELLTTVSDAVEGLHAGHVVEMKQRATEAHRSHDGELSRMRSEHALELGKLERTLDISKRVIQQQREEAHREKASLCVSHSKQMSCLAEFAARRQATAQEEGSARVGLAVAFRHAAMRSARCGEICRQLIDGHAAHAAKCVAEHTAWLRGLREVAVAVGDATRRQMTERFNQQLEECLGSEHSRRSVFTLEEESERALLVLFFETFSLRCRENEDIMREMLSATDAMLFESGTCSDSMMASQVCVPSIANYAAAMSLLEQYKQCAFEEFVAHLVALSDLFRAHSLNGMATALRDEYELKIVALKAEWDREILLLQKEEAERKIFVDKVREISDFGAKLDLLEKSVLQKAQQDTCQHNGDLYPVKHGWRDNNSTVAHQRRQNTRIGGFFSSLFPGFSSKSIDATSTGVDTAVLSPLDKDDEWDDSFSGARTPLR